MIKLLMHTHIDGLTMPEGKERYPHEHKWRVGKGDEQDRLGRPYCTECGGMPCWFELEEIDDKDSSLNYYIESGNYRVVERDEGSKPMLSKELRRLSEEASRRNAITTSESFILFVKERAMNTAKYGHLSFAIQLSSLPWSEKEMVASYPALTEDGLKVSIEDVARSPMDSMSVSSSLGSNRPRELKVSW